MSPRRPIVVSVVTVCFNAAAVLPRAIASLHAQRWPHVEWVVIDGGSRDGTQALVQGAARPPAVFVSEPDRGIYDAMNKAIARCSGDLVFFLNADDRLHDPGVIEDVASLFEADPSIELLHGDVVVERAGGAPLVKRSFHINRWTLPIEDLCHQGVFARRSLFERVGAFDLRWHTSADYDWLIKVFNSRAKVRYVDRRIAYYTAGGAHARDLQALGSERRILRLRYLRPWQLKGGTFLSQVVHRLSRELRGGLRFDELAVDVSADGESASRP